MTGIDLQALARELKKGVAELLRLSVLTLGECTIIEVD